MDHLYVNRLKHTVACLWLLSREVSVLCCLLAAEAAMLLGDWRHLPTFWIVQSVWCIACCWKREKCLGCPSLSLLA